jgi:hypothetical protein
VAESPDSSATGRSDSAPPTDSVELVEAQLKFAKVAPAEERDFPIEKVSVGSIGYVQIREGVKAGELVATEGALFLSTALAISAQ